MKNERSNVIQIPLRGGTERDNSAPLRTGDTVTHSGIYEMIHERHSRGAGYVEVVAVQGERVQPCKTCGGEVQLRLLYGAPHILEDADFHVE